MSNVVKVGGVDPGPRPGLVILHIQDGRLLRVERGGLTWLRVVDGSDYVAVEKYVRGRASVRSHDSGAQLETQRMAQDVMEACTRLRRTFQALPAGAVKPWATDDRLRAYAAPSTGPSRGTATLYALTAGGGGHDRDAGRHALNFAVKLGWLPKR